VSSGRGRGMGGRCALAVDADGRAALEQLSRSAVRGEADRARAVLWSLAGETSAAIAARLDVRAEQVRRWRPAVRAGGVAALRSRPRPGRAGPGRAPRKREAALAVAREVLGGPATDRPVWTLARLAREIEARTGEAISSAHLSVVLHRGATAGAGRGTHSRAGRTRTPSTAPACGPSR
jgi:transposase